MAWADSPVEVAAARRGRAWGEKEAAGWEDENATPAPTAPPPAAKAAPASSPVRKPAQRPGGGGGGSASPGTVSALLDRGWWMR